MNAADFDQIIADLDEQGVSRNAADRAAALLSAAIVDMVVVERLDAGKPVDRASVLAAHDRVFAATWPVLVERVVRQRPHIGRVLVAALAA